MTSIPTEPSHAPLRPSRYRPDIDGLRAIAVLAVVGYHAFPGWIRGGFVGVDVFFVISGYLITGIIYRHISAGDFSIIDFYNRRIRRIFPALLVVTFSTFLAGWFVLAPRDFESLGTNILGGALFVQNFVLLGQVGYFDLEAAKKPLLHLWSLGIEEQYYIGWPLLLLLFRRARLDAGALSIALIVGSFGFGLVAFKLGPDLAFYLPFSRAWELLVGSALSIFLMNGTGVPAWRWIADPIRRRATLVGVGSKQPGLASDPLGHSSVIPEALAACALLALAFAVVRYKPYTPYPGSAAVITVTAATVMILTPGSTINRVFLSSRPMVFIGLISYPLYLWHFPLMAYARILSGDAVSHVEMTGIVALSVLLAWATYRFVEWPIRRGPTISRGRIAALGGGMAGVGALGLVVMVTQGFPMRIPTTVRSLMVTNEEAYAHWRRGRCLMLPEQSAKDFAPECAGSGPRPLLFAWGDSYAAALYPGLEHFAGSRGYGVSEFTASACPPLIGYVYPERPFCKPINDFVLTKIAEERPDVVILHSTWTTSDADLEKGLAETTVRLKALHVKKIVLLGPVASWLGDGLVENTLQYYYQHGFTLIPERTTYRSNDAWARARDAWLRAEAEKLDIAYVSPRSVMCTADGCLARIGENGSEITAFDWGHLTKAGAIFVVGSLIDQLLPHNVTGSAATTSLPTK